MSRPMQVTQKCKNCGGNMYYNPTKGGLLCQRCNNFVAVEGTATSEKSFQDILKSAPSWQKDTIVFRCEHCGAKIVAAKFDLVTKCDYCGETNMVKTQESSGSRPDTVILFELNREEATGKVNDWLSKRIFAPSEFKQIAKNRELTCVYCPAFTFDANVVTRYSAVLVQSNTTTVTVDGKAITRTQTSKRGINDLDTRTFDDILILANDEITPNFLEQIKPFNTNEGKVFQQSYLSGFTVGNASKDAQKCWNEAKKTMEDAVRAKLMARYCRNGTTLEDLQLESNFTNITYKYVLLPIYIGSTKYKGVQYPLYLNGQTGKLYGKTPKSWWKILLTCAGMGILAFVFGIFLAMIF